MLLTQFMAQKQQGITQGTTFAMLQYPWLPGGCTQVQYLKDQFVAINHVQRLIRGLHVGSLLNFNCMTHETTLSHAAVFTTPDKRTTIGA